MKGHFDLCTNLDRGRLPKLIGELHFVLVRKTDLSVHNACFLVIFYVSFKSHLVYLSYETVICRASHTTIYHIHFSNNHF